MASIARKTANRAVHLHVKPRPSNLGESREIWRLISMFGEVEYFKNFQYDNPPSYDSAVVIFREESAAQSCLQGDPIRFRMGKMPVARQDGSNESESAPESSTQEYSSQSTSSTNAMQSPYNPFRLSQTRSISTEALPMPPPRPIQTLFEPPPPQLSESRIFQIRVNPARRHFRDQIDTGTYHGSFSIDTKSIAQQDLAKSVPAAGLSCVNWRAEGRPWRHTDKEKDEERRTGKSLRQLYAEGAGQKGTLENAAFPG